MKSAARNVFRNHKMIYALFLLLFSTTPLSQSQARYSTEDIHLSRHNEEHNTYLPLLRNDPYLFDCSQTQLGAILLTEQVTGESTGPYLANLAQAGYSGLAGAPSYTDAEKYFPQLDGWQRAHICNSHDCLVTKAERAANEGMIYEYLAYGPERLEGVPDEEKFNLPWATQVARQIADQWQKKLVISYSTVQLHQEAEERGYDWNDPSEIVKMLAPYGDIWLIQAADEYWRIDDVTVRPVLSQRVYPPGPDFRAEVERWVHWVKAANPDIEIWIQLALQRIGVAGENEPSADLLLAYSTWIDDLVDGIYIMPIYGSLDQFPAANLELVDVFQRACQGQSLAAAGVSTQLPGEISLVEEGWTDDLTIPCPPEGDCITLLSGYYYRIYENSQYPCGSQGNHQFMVLERDKDTSVKKHLFIKFLGGAVGFWYQDNNQARIYYPNERAVGILTASNNRNMFFRTSVSREYANGVTKRFRENGGFRILVPSYCSHDLYHGRGEYDAMDGFSRWGYQAAMESVDFVQEYYATDRIITYGGSAGAAGSFYVGKDQDSVAGIIMDSQAVDLSAISVACEEGVNVFGNSYPCFCPQGGPTCMQVLAPRIGFEFGLDEPYHDVEEGLDKPIYYVWNQYDASNSAYLQFENLDKAIDLYNPGSNSITNMVCIANPDSPPGPTCNLHVPSAYDYPETQTLVEQIYYWALGLLINRADFDHEVYLPNLLKY